jgi:hypothetical protein
MGTEMETVFVVIILLNCNMYVTGWFLESSIFEMEISVEDICWD